MNSPEQLLRRLLDEAMSAFDATGGAVYLGNPGHLRLVYSSTGTGIEDEQISAPLMGSGEQQGLISLGVRRNGLDYTPQDHRILQEIVDVVARAINMGEHPREA